MLLIRSDSLGANFAYKPPALWLPGLCAGDSLGQWRYRRASTETNPLRGGGIQQRTVAQK